MKVDIEITVISKKAIGFEKGGRKSFSPVYNSRCDPDLNIGKAAIKSIPCKYSIYIG